MRCLLGILAASLLVAENAHAAPPSPRPGETPVLRQLPQVDPCTVDAIRRELASAEASSPQGGEARSAAFRTRATSCITARLGWLSAETSGPSTWTRARADADAFLFGLFRGGVLVGAVAEHAYFVRCDATTMTAAEVDQGLVVCSFGGAVIKPAELEVGSVRVMTRGRDPTYVPLPPFDASRATSTYERCSKRSGEGSKTLEAIYGRLLPCFLDSAEREASSERTLPLLARDLDFVRAAEISAKHIGTAGFVRCDATTTSRADASAGVSVCLFAYAPSGKTLRGATMDLHVLRVRVAKKGSVTVEAL